MYVLHVADPPTNLFSRRARPYVPCSPSHLPVFRRLTAIRVPPAPNTQVYSGKEAVNVM